MGRGRLARGGGLIIALLFSGWDQIQAWRLLQGETVTIVPDPSLEAETVQESLRVSAALRNHLYRFQARTLLRSSPRSGRPVILRSSGGNLPRDLDRARAVRFARSDHVRRCASLLRSRGWKIVEQRFPKQAYVVLEPAAQSLSRGGRRVCNLQCGRSRCGCARPRGRNYVGVRQGPDPYVEDHFTFVQLVTFLEESTGASESRTPSLIQREMRGHTRSRCLLPETCTRTSGKSSTACGLRCPRRIEGRIRPAFDPQSAREYAGPHARRDPDALLIGAGPTGAVTAKRLVEAGMRVVVLEQGDWPDYGRARAGASTSSSRPGATGPGTGRRRAPADYPVSDTDSDISAINFNAVGGGTVIYAAHWQRNMPSDFRVRSLDGVADDWPLSYEDLVPYYERVEEDFGVSGLEGDPAFPPGKGPPLPPAPLAPMGKRVARAHSSWAGTGGPGPMPSPRALTALSARAQLGRPACGAASRAPRPRSTARTGRS